MNPTREIRIAGFGGQGVILAGMVIGRAATLFDTQYVTLTQSFGPEARGSAASVQLIVSPSPVLYPYLTRLDILVAMSQEAYVRFVGDLEPNGLLIYEQDLVQTDDLRGDLRAYGIPGTRMAEALGRKLVLNMVMVGLLVGLTNLVKPEALRQSIAVSVPTGTQTLNTVAFDKGFEYALAEAARLSSQEAGHMPAAE
jgi:2-oxoglutarate ferredoxin oxidoreductase subunit gamma